MDTPSRCSNTCPGSSGNEPFKTLPDTQRHAITSFLFWVLSIITSALENSTISQVWRDYMSGRRLRLAKELRQAAPASHRPTTATTNDRPGRKAYSDDETNLYLAEESDKRKVWCIQRCREHPWRIERTIQGGTSWSATWILEVKDIEDVNWTQQKIYDETGWRWEFIPAPPHWPFEQGS